MKHRQDQELLRLKYRYYNKEKIIPAISSKSSTTRNKLKYNSAPTHINFNVGGYSNIMKKEAREVKIF